MKSPASLPPLPPMPAQLVSAAPRVEAAVLLLRGLVRVGADPAGRDNVATLIDGSEVSSSSEAWRAECAARREAALALLAMPNREARAARLARLTAEAGAEHVRRLEAAVLVLWAARMLELSDRAASAAAVSALVPGVLIPAAADHGVAA